MIRFGSGFGFGFYSVFDLIQFNSKRSRKPLDIFWARIVYIFLRFFLSLAFVVCSPGGLCGPTAIGGAHAIVGAGIIRVDMANIFRLNSIFAIFMGFRTHTHKRTHTKTKNVYGLLDCSRRVSFVSRCSAFNAFVCLRIYVSVWVGGQAVVCVCVWMCG